ncbi:hypothetical protein Aple_093540 [Acrocarpospora pleiomorpha]|uniref:Uncharacterized protein n=1 Tax=Acrocarpospora pleiomorpha TaxID=90975 RepID=A0A5M3XZA4_9ACTN|nr:hypothetical protein Aple_093540 [Acrocarpospora pleiomorpha]
MVPRSNVPVSNSPTSCARNGPPGRALSIRLHKAGRNAGQYCICNAPTAATTAPTGPARRSSSPCLASSARFNARSSITLTPIRAE